MTRQQFKRRINTYRRHLELFAVNGQRLPRNEITRGRRLVERLEKWLRATSRSSRKALKFRREVFRKYIRQNLFESYPEVSMTDLLGSVRAASFDAELIKRLGRIS